MRIADATRWPRFYNWVQGVLADRDLNKRVITEGLCYRRGARVLDIGCGTGLYADLVEPADYLGVDILPGYIETARRTFPDRRFELGDAREVRRLGLRFDRAMSIGLLHHLPDADVLSLLGEIRSSLAPDGFLYVFEAIWPPNRLDVIGGLIRYFDRGEFVRTTRRWRELFGEYRIEGEQVFYNRFCPTYAARLYPR
jgi:SAM-dependent methyltransferase